MSGRYRAPPEATTPVMSAYAGGPSAGRVCAPGAADRALKSPRLSPPGCAVLGRAREWNLLVLGYSILEKFWENSSIYSYLILEFSGTRVYTHTQYLSKYVV